MHLGVIMEPATLESWMFCVRDLLDLVFFLNQCINFFYHIFYAWGSPSISCIQMLIPVSVAPVISLDFPSLGFLLFVFSIFLLFRFSGLEQFYLFPLPSKCIFLYFVRRFVCFLFKDLYVFGCIFLYYFKRFTMSSLKVSIIFIKLDLRSFFSFCLC